MIFYSIGKRIKNFVKVTIFLNPKNRRNGIFSSRYNQEAVQIVKRYYDNGRIKAECSYKNEKLEGLSVHYYESGQVKLKENYRDGLLEGLSIGFYKTGRVEYEVYYKRGKILYKRVFDLKGQLQEELKY